MYNSLSVLENCIDVKPDVAPEIAEASGLLKWLCGRLSPKTEVDSNKQYSSEVLAVVLQSGGAKARLKFVEMGGVDRALEAVAPYRSRGVCSIEEEEFVENVFDILCAVLMEDSAKESFLKYEGVELMILVLKGRTSSRTAALKCLDFATTRYGAACDRAVAKGLLPLLFGIFMGKMKIKKDKDSTSKRANEVNREEEESRAVSIISNLLAGSGEENKSRTLSKFVENEFEKCDRLMEIFTRYATKVAEEERRIHALYEGEQDEDEILLARMDAGLFTLQQCTLIIAVLWSTADYGLRKRILTLLHQQRYTLGFLRMIMTEYVNSLGSEEVGDEQNGDAKESSRVSELLNYMTLHEPKEETE